MVIFSNLFIIGIKCKDTDIYKTYQMFLENPEGVNYRLFNNEQSTSRKDDVKKCKKKLKYMK